jgi:hypothetical protein
VGHTHHLEPGRAPQDHLQALGDNRLVVAQDNANGVVLHRLYIPTTLRFLTTFLLKFDVRHWKQPKRRPVE